MRVPSLLSQMARNKPIYHLYRDVGSSDVSFMQPHREIKLLSTYRLHYKLMQMTHAKAIQLYAALA
jgi:hypothetical protein